MRSLFIVLLFHLTSLSAVELLENFDTPGLPATSSLVNWGFAAELRPVKDWKEICPGEGYAYLTIDADPENNQKKKKWPFQTIFFDAVGPNHRLEMRAKHNVIPGVASFIFTNSEADGVVDEIDIEIVGDDTQVDPTPHPTGQEGWTDARFNTWANADVQTLKPFRSHAQPVKDAEGRKLSLEDEDFHTFTIDWFEDKVVFYIDGVHQQTITDVVPDSPGSVIFGMRHMSWTGDLDWEGTRTMIIDWVKVTPLSPDKEEKK